MTKPEVTHPLVRSWLRHLRAEGRSPKTSESYERILRAFGAHLSGDVAGDVPGDLREVSRADVEDWLAHLRETGRAPATVRASAVALKSFYRWLVEEDEITRSPCPRLPKAPEGRAPAVLTPEVVAALLDACAGKGFMARRDRALINLLATTGMRRAEISGLALEDVDLDRRLIAVVGKGQKFRYVRMTPEAARDLDRYLRIRASHKAADSPALWLGQRGPLTFRAVEGLLKARARRAGIGHVHPHQFRHTFAHGYLSRGGQEGDLQQLGGWADSRTMGLYGRQLRAERALAAYDGVMG